MNKPTSNDFVTYRHLLVVIVTATSMWGGLLSVAFAWHKEAPHPGTITEAVFRAEMRGLRRELELLATQVRESRQVTAR